MPRAEGQKQKLLLLRELLLRETDEAHELTMPEILKRLKDAGIPSARQSVYRDLETLAESGLDVKYEAGRGYYVASRGFELAELKLLVDAVQATRFLTEKKTMELIAKLEGLVSRYDAGKLHRQVAVTGRVKNMNESVFYNVDRIHGAIAENSQIRFRYFDWAVDGAKEFRPGEYKASPIALCWAEENYYLIAGSDRHGLTHYRVDKMQDIELTGEPRRFTKETRALDLASHTRSVFSMFSGEPRRLRLRFANRLSGVVFDRFGRESMLIPDGPDHFVFTAEIAVSPTFLGWLSGFGAEARILSPEDVVERYRDFLRETLAQYEK